MKPLELLVALAVIVVAAAYTFRRNPSNKMSRDEAGLKRLIIYGVVILIASVVLWNAVESQSLSR